MRKRVATRLLIRARRGSTRVQYAGCRVRPLAAGCRPIAAPPTRWPRRVRRVEDSAGRAVVRVSSRSSSPCRLFARVLADCLEHPVALVGVSEEALLDERLEGVEVGVGDLFGGLERAAAGEHRQRPEQPLLVLGEEVVRPLDRRAQRLLARVGVAAALQQVEPLARAAPGSARVTSAFVARRRARRPAAGCRAARTARGSRRSARSGPARRTVRRPRARRGAAPRTRPHRRRAAARATSPAARRFGQARRSAESVGGGVDHLLEVVEQQQQLALADVLGELVLGAQRLRDRLDHQRRVTQRRKPDPEDAGLELRDKRRRCLERKACLARAARPGET